MLDVTLTQQLKTYLANLREPIELVATLGEGRKSVAIEVTLLPTDRTLTDAEIDAVIEKVVAAVSKATGATLRS